MAVGIEAGAPFDRRDLAAQIGNAVRRARVGGGGEQPDDAEFAGEIAGCVEALDADVVEIDAAVHVGVDIGLGDDQRPRLLQESHDLRRELQQLVAALEHLQLAVAHDAERAVEIGLERVAVEFVVAQAEEGEMVGRQPLQELDRFRDLVDRQRRRIGLQLGDDGVDALDHRAPILHRAPHLFEHGLQAAHQIGAGGGFLDRIDVDVDEAFALAAGGIGRAERNELCALPRHAQNRVRDQPHGKLAVGKLADHRVEQKRHVVIGDCQHRDRPVRSIERQRLAGDLRTVCRPLGQEIPGTLGEHGEIGRGVTHHVFRHRARKDLRHESRRHVAAPLAQFGSGLRDRLAGGGLFLAAGKLNGHGVLACVRDHARRGISRSL